ncbi:MAG: TIGR00153 family protein [Xanthomonadales bacterium]|nr:TIGR00153 family protein [Xanthomonadales bacterium]
MSGSYLSGIFGKSPVRPLQEHMEKVVSCVCELIPFTRAVLNRDQQARVLHHQNIVAMENEADALKKELRLHLPNSLFMPIDRRDVLEVLTMQDMVAGRARNVAGLITGRDMQIPDSMAKGYAELVQRSIDACTQAYTAIKELDELIETGFGKAERERVGGLLYELDEIEQHTDEQQIALRNELFKLEDELHPVNVMFLYKVIDSTGGIADRAQRVGSRLQLMLAR